MTQTRLESFFIPSTNPKFDDKVKRCFIYDPEMNHAFFAFRPDPTGRDEFITTKSDLKLYRRRLTGLSHPPPIKIMQPWSIHLLKSNLQKAIRRGNAEVAVKTALAMLQKNPMELMRRLPIIFVEDVCPLRSLPVPVWLMMAGNDVELTPIDVENILNIVADLCECRHVFPYRKSMNVLEYVTTHEELQHLHEADVLLAIHYRSFYGGMADDIKMLHACIQYYRSRPSEIAMASPISRHSINFADMTSETPILKVAIDFHPFPNILSEISEKTKLTRATVKEFIWNTESAVNIRKPSTIDISAFYRGRNEWLRIETCLHGIRDSIRSEYDDDNNAA